MWRHFSLSTFSLVRYRIHWNYFSRNLLNWYLLDTCPATSCLLFNGKIRTLSYKDFQRFFRKKLHIFKTIENEMILSLAKHLNEKMREQLVKIFKERKRHVRIFQHFQSMIWKQEKQKCRYENTQPKHNNVLSVGKLNNSESTQQYFSSVKNTTIMPKYDVMFSVCLW